jgi:hypothetical protein
MEGNAMTKLNVNGKPRDVDVAQMCRSCERCATC